MKHDTSGGAGLILRGSVQLRAEIVQLNQAELHQGSEFDVEASADGGGEGCIGAEAKAPRADGSHLYASDGNCVLRLVATLALHAARCTEEDEDQRSHRP